MTVAAFQSHAVESYVGVAGDTKPTSANVGALFFETDTGTFYIFDATSAWVVYPLALTGSVTIGAISVADGADVALGHAADSATTATVSGKLAGILAALQGGEPVIFKNIAAQAIVATVPFDLWTPASGKKYELLGWSLSTTVAGSIIFKNKHVAAYTEFLRTPLLLASTPHDGPTLQASDTPGVADDILALDVTISGTVSGFVFGREA